MQPLGLVKDIVQNALMGIPVVRTQAMRLHSTGMNDDPEALGRQWAFYVERGGVDGKRILELGPGRSLQLLEKALQEGATQCAALDVVTYEDALEVARRAGIDFRRYDGTRFPHDDGTFDLVWSSDVLEHVADPRAVLGECARVLAPGGLCVSRIDLRDHLHLQDPREWLDCLRYTDATWRLMTSNRSTFVNRLRVSAWERVFQETGFAIRGLSTLEVPDDVLCHYASLSWLRPWGRRDLAVYRIDVVLEKPPTA